MARDFYAVLALPRNASEDQIRQRFRELARLLDTRRRGRENYIDRAIAELDLRTRRASGEHVGAARR